MRNRLVSSLSIYLITATKATTDTRVHDFCSGKVEEILTFYQSGHRCWNSEMFSWCWKSGNLHIESTKRSRGSGQLRRWAGFGVRPTPGSLEPEPMAVEVAATTAISPEHGGPNPGARGMVGGGASRAGRGHQW
jgi:hypothetical protein